MALIVIDVVVNFSLCIDLVSKDSTNLRKYLHNPEIFTIDDKALNALLTILEETSPSKPALKAFYTVIKIPLITIVACAKYAQASPNVTP